MNICSFTSDYVPDQIFAIKGLKIGQVNDFEGITGVTVLQFDEGATCAVDVRGAAPGTRETDLFRPENLVEKTHAIVLAGGSAFGLAAMSGVTCELSRQNIGLKTEAGRIPIVTGAVLYDLTIGRSDRYPDDCMGEQASRNASRSGLIEGSVGAGTGATVGKVTGPEFATKSGLGTFCLIKDELVVAAVVAVNAWGDVVHNGAVIAGARDPERQSFINSRDTVLAGKDHPAFAGQNTTIGAVVTNASLSKSQALKVAQMTHDGYARAISPVHTLFDGDTVFAAATGEIEESNTHLIGIMAAEVMEQAIHRAVYTAETLAGIPAMNDLTDS